MNNDNNKLNWMSVGGIKTHARARILLISLVYGAYYYLKTNGIIAAPGQLWPDAVAALGAVYALFTYYWASMTDKAEKSHLTATLFFDVIMVTAASIMLGPFGTALFPLYLMIVFAYGLPNGEHHLQISAGLSSVAFSIAYVANPWWNDPVMAAGLLSTLFFLPLMAAYSHLGKGAVVAAQQEAAEEQSKAQALSELSQELHTQISEVITSSQGLLQQRNMSPQRKRLTRSIANSSASALRLVKEVDEYARLSSGQHEYLPRETSLIEVLEKISRQVTDEADKKQLNYEVIFDLNMLQPVQTCASELRRVLEHLIFNSIKYTEKGYVRVTVTEKLTDGDTHWRFEVADSGVGIDSSEQTTVFDPFVRAHAGRSHETRGIGLGATIARQLVEGMGGKIGMESAVNEGSTFWFEIPMTRLEQVSKEELPPINLSCLSLTPKEKTQIDQMEADGFSRNTHVEADDFPDLASESAECLVVGEHVGNQQFLQVLDTTAQSRDVPPPVVRFQRLQPDDLVIYSRQKGGDILFLPTTTSNDCLAALLNQCGHRSADQDESSEPSKEKLSVLIADGSNVSRDILATMLVNRGHQIYMARTPIQAQDILSGIKLDLLLIDPRMADEKVLAGMQHCQSKGSAIKCLLLSDADGASSVNEELKAFVAGEIPRPYQSAYVYQTIEQLFGLTAPTEPPSGHSADSAISKMMLADDPALMDAAVLDELNQVDSGNVLVSRFIQRYTDHSSTLINDFVSACDRSEYDDAIIAAKELAHASDQIGLRQLAGYCERLCRVEKGDFLKRSTSYGDEISTLYNRSIGVLQKYARKEQRS